MKKWWIVVLPAILALMVFIVYVNKDLFYVNVTIPSSFYVSGTNVEELISQSEEEGIQATRNSDGSITYRMNRIKHIEMLREQKREIHGTIKEIIASEDHPSIHDISYNDSLSQLTILVDRSTFEGDFNMDGVVSMLLGMLCVKYQLYNGASLDDQPVKVTIQDLETNKVIRETLLP